MGDRLGRPQGAVSFCKFFLPLSMYFNSVVEKMHPQDHDIIRRERSTGPQAGRARRTASSDRVRRRPGALQLLSLHGAPQPRLYVCMRTTSSFPDRPTGDSRGKRSSPLTTIQEGREIKCESEILEPRVASTCRAATRIIRISSSSRSRIIIIIIIIIIISITIVL